MTLRPPSRRRHNRASPAATVEDLHQLAGNLSDIAGRAPELQAALANLDRAVDLEDLDAAVAAAEGVQAAAQIIGLHAGAIVGRLRFPPLPPTLRRVEHVITAGPSHLIGERGGFYEPIEET